MMAKQRDKEVVANNLANMNTAGYQRRRTEFTDLVYQASERRGSASSRPSKTIPGGVVTGQGVRLASIYRVSEQGTLASTANPLDLAIQGEGYFQVLLPNGDTAYTRDGTFQLNATGEMVTHDGFTLQPGITIPSGAIDVTINASGEVLVVEGIGEGASNVGTLQIATFPNEGGLKALGDNLFGETAGSGAAATNTPGTEGYGTVLQGFVESSNVNPIEEVAALIMAQRAYEMNSKVVQTADKMMGPAR